MKTFIATILLSLILFNVGCASESTLNEASQFERINVDNLWQGSIPVGYENRETACQNTKEPNLLIPYAVSKNSPLQIDLYACWPSLSFMSCSTGEVFEEPQIETEGNKVHVSLWHSYFFEEECGGILGGLRKFHTIEINGPWQRGELEIVVQNSDDELTGFVTVE